MPDLLQRVPPQNLDAEQSVLGAILLDNKAFDDVMAWLTAEMFYRESHKQIYAAMLQMADKRIEIDAVTLSETLKTAGQLEAVGGAGYIAELAAFVPTAANIEHYGQIVRDKATLRDIASAASGIATRAYDVPEDVQRFADEAANAICQVTDGRVEHTAVTSAELMRSTMSNVETAMESGRGMVTGVSSGFIDVDRLTMGWQRGNLIILAARPALGKSAIALNMAVHAAVREGYRVVFFSIEMSKEEVGLRLLSTESKLSLTSLRGGYISKADYPSLLSAQNVISEADLIVDDNSGLSPLGMKAVLRRLARERPAGLVFVDYLQLIKPSKRYDSREREVAEISRELKLMARELEVPVVCLAQLNRQVESRESGRPRLADLRESGAIEQNADVVMFIHNTEYLKAPESRDPNAPTLLLLAKQRNGPTGDIQLTWQPDIVRFDNYAEIPN